MGSRLNTSPILASVFLLAASGAARASIIEAKVPFDFVAGGRVMPSGTYRIEADNMDSSVLLIRGEKGNHAAVFILTTPVEGPHPGGASPTLSFSKHETQYFLDDVWESGNEGHEVARPGHHKS